MERAPGATTHERRGRSFLGDRYDPAQRPVPLAHDLGRNTIKRSALRAPRSRRQDHLVELAARARDVADVQRPLIGAHDCRNVVAGARYGRFMNKTSKKLLPLRTETLRRLVDDELNHAAGGSANSDSTMGDGRSGRRLGDSDVMLPDAP